MKEPQRSDPDEASSRSAGRAPRHAVILAGGAGERFWPASRAAHPKPLLALAGGRSLLAATLARARRFAGKGRVWLVCGREHHRAMRRATGLPASRVLVEPERRNTGMAVALAAQRIAETEPGAVMAVLPADHRIAPEGVFDAALRRAARAAVSNGVLVTVGVAPSRPETGYGYIRIGKSVGKGHPGLHRVARFVEKPDRERARRYLRSGAYLWNAGIFVWTAQAIREEIEAHAPKLAAAVARLAAKTPRGTPRGRLAGAYRIAPAVPIDRAVLERSRRVWCLPVSFQWSDVGSWQSLADLLGAGTGANRSAVVAGEAVLCDAPGNLVWGGRRLVALLGVAGLAVVDTGDALLVARLDRSDELRRIVKELRGRGHRNLV
jgi:mannose-1-phosphate guanylyltransferase/mannose-6-phosphate isomerase